MKKVNSVLLLCLLLVATSCNLKTYSGEKKTEKRSVESYDAIAVYGSFDVSIDPNKKSGLTVSAPEDALPFIKTRVENKELIIDMDHSGFMNPEMTVVIGNDVLNQITISGSGDFEGEVKSKSELKLSVRGSGEIRIETKTEKITATVSGSGDISGKGRCEQLKANVSGSGDIDFSQMATHDADVTVSGSGDIAVNVSGNLEAVVSGSGDIKYSGNPEKVSKTVSGSGEVSPR